MKLRVPAIVAFCVAAAALGAAPLKRSDVSADPLRLLHIDCDALRETYLGKYILFQLDKPEMHSNMVAFQSIFSFDLRTQLHGMTVYSDGPSAEEAVAIAYADFDPDRFVIALKGGDAVEIFTNSTHVIYSWRDKKKNPNDPPSPRKYAVVQKGRVVTSQTKESLIAAMSVIDHPAQTSPEPKSSVDLKGDAVVMAKARNMDFLGSDPAGALIKMSKRLSLEVYESDEKLNGNLAMEADSETTAKQMSVAAQGLIALLSLLKDNPRAAKLADGILVKQDQTNLTIGFAVSSKDVIAAWKTFTAKKEQSKGGK